MKKVLFSFLMLSICTLTVAADADTPGYYYTTKVKKGEGVIALLKRYELFDYDCNIDKFYQLNESAKLGGLKTHMEYKLPIQIYTYNGKSIRSTLSIDDYNQALKIQRYNERIRAKGLRSKSIQSSKILWVPHHLLHCVDVDSDQQKKLVSTRSENGKVDNGGVKDESSSGSYSLFGKKYAKLDMVDNSLRNQVFFIVAGHGGPDPGARCTDCKSTMCEDEYAYDVALRLSKNLMERGAIVHMVIEDENDGIRDEAYLKCDRDEKTMTGRKLPLRQLDRLKQRADIINRLSSKYKKEGKREQKAIMIHVDSRAKNKKQDVFFYYYGKSKSSKKLAYKMMETFEAKYNKYQKNRGYKGYIKDRGLYMLRKTDPQAVYVELANIRNKDDHKRLIKAYNRQALADWLYEGLVK